MSNGILLVLDGWGTAPPGPGNMIAEASTPVLDELAADYPPCLLAASGEAVGLLPHTVGNSEIGHLVIGAGRPLPYESVRVQQYLDSGEIGRDPAFARFCAGTARLHLVGLCSDGQIHADIGHLGKVIEAAAAHGLRDIQVHAITDGRDVPDHTAALHLKQVTKFLGGFGRVATVSGRGYAMDKSGDAALTDRVVRAIADGHGPVAVSAERAVAAPADGDVWIPPTVIGGPVPLGDGDRVLFTHFRSDRIQQLADSLVRHTADRSVEWAALAPYDTAAPIPALISRVDASGGLADELETLGLRSVRIAEAEKFEHVTFYLNGRNSRRRAVEDHVRIGDGAQRDYRVEPEMSLDAVVAEVTTAAARDDVALVVANLANIDVVGHTAHAAATRRAVEHTDAAVGRILDAARETGRWLMLVGDHGNGEQMLRDDKIPYGGHTTNPVPLIVVGSVGLPPHGTLADVAPTILRLLGHAPGSAMTGRALGEVGPPR
ncbi:2,3-bisphosphoglycerate-independent phosphoglycerate mutase [Actinokineospora sp.]|uniref:2,3-bisphosphoglycerate-independent phosphoglycerate mutase n=1 Tax=Actinokineospora sp. TaxID=1872133 RepID=UPI004037637F